MSVGFAGMPPEVISGLIYSGPGSSSMVAAASAWNGLAAELANTAQGYSTVVLQLAGEEWLGPASAAMAAAVQPYVTWLTTTAGQAEQAATQATSAAAAFETAFASVVPPPMIAANRAMLAQATQTNIFGINNGIIAQLEALYAEYWAQDVGAMSTYAASSAAASKVTLFTPAPTIANASGTGTQAAATAAAQAAITPGQIQTSLQQILQGVTNFNPSQITQGVTAFSANNPLTEIWFLLTGQSVLPTNLGALLNGYSPFASFFYNTEGLPYFSVGMGNFGTQIAKSAGWLGGAAPAAAAAAKPPGMGALGAAGGPVAAGLGNASHVGGHLAVPASWSGTTSAPATVRPAVQAISEPITSGESGAGNVLGGMPIGGTGAARGAGAGPRYGFKPTVMTRPLSAG